MAGWRRAMRRAAAPAAVASLTSIAALMALARAEGRGALQPLNATSHWLNGRGAARVASADMTHTGVGVATHVAATWFWAVLFERWTAARRSHAPAARLRDALLLSAFAAGVDYLATPKRFTPGWEFVLSKRAMAAVYAAMAVGLAAGSAPMTRRTSPPQRGA